MDVCGKFEDLLARYIHGRLLLQDEEELEIHLSMCSACGKLYRAAVDLDRVLREMPGKRVDPPPHLRSKILANLPERPGSRAWLQRGRWTAALGAAAACLLAAVVLYRGASLPPESKVVPAPAPPAAAKDEPSPAVSLPAPSLSTKRAAPAPASSRIIREVKIYFYHPTATKVAVTGDFNGWNPEGVLLAASGKRGIWEATLRLSPGAYSYNFIVDGNLLVPDPNAPEQMPDGYGGTNSILLVKGGNPA